MGKASKEPSKRQAKQGSNQEGKGRIEFLLRNYCDIEKYPIPKVVGQLPQQERLLSRKQLECLLSKAKSEIGTEFSEELSAKSSKRTIKNGKRNVILFWLDIDTWDELSEQKAKGWEI